MCRHILLCHISVLVINVDRKILPRIWIKIVPNCKEVGYGGDDETRTRDLRRDRPAF